MPSTLTCRLLIRREIVFPVTQRPTDIASPVERGANGGHQLVTRRVLQHISERTRREAAVHQDGSSCTVTSTIRAAGSPRKISATASIPSRIGIEMSATITSGGEPCRGADKSVAVFHHCDHLEVGLKQLPRAATLWRVRKAP